MRELVSTIDIRPQVIKEKFPVFVFGFFIVWVANCFHLWPQPATNAMEQVMIWFFTFCFVGLGLQTKLADMKKAGIKGIVTGYSLGILKVGITLAIILILTKKGILH